MKSSCRWLNLICIYFWEREFKRNKIISIYQHFFNIWTLFQYMNIISTYKHYFNIWTLLYSGLFDIWVNSPLNPTGCQMRQYTPDRCREHTSLFAYNRPGAYTSYCAQRAYGEDHRERDQPRRRWTESQWSCGTRRTWRSWSLRTPWTPSVGSPL